MKNKYEFSKQERKAIYKRDNNQCVIAGCHNNFGMGVAHVFVPRSKGGLGVKENGVLLCQQHHEALDCRNKPFHDEVKYLVENHLFNHYGNIEKEDVTYNKWKGFMYG